MTAATSSATTSPDATIGSRRSDYLALAARLMIAAIFLLSGFSKLAAPSATIGFIGSVGLPFPTMGYAGALAVELGISLALVVGFKTRLAAAVLAAFSVMTAIVFHGSLGEQDQFIQFWKNVAIAGGLLQIAAFGPGRLSVDRR